MPSSQPTALDFQRYIFFVSFHRGRAQSGILFLVSIARATARRIYHGRPWLSDVGHLRGCSLSVPCATKLWRASVCRTEAVRRGKGLSGLVGRVLTPLEEGG